MRQRVENPSDQDPKNSLPLYKKIGVGIVAAGLAFGPTGCSTGNAEGSGATPSVSASETPSGDPSAPTETATPTEVESPAPETNPFVTEQFKELDAMTLEQFAEQPLELRLLYRTAFFHKYKDSAWTGFVTSSYDNTLPRRNPLITKPTLDDTNMDIAKQGLFAEVAASAAEFIDSDVDDYGRGYSLEAALKLALTSFVTPLSEMDEHTMFAYKEQVKRIESSFSDGIPGIDAKITLDRVFDVTRSENIDSKVDGKPLQGRVVRARFDNSYNGDSWAMGIEYVYIEEIINGQPISQWLIRQAAVIPIDFIPLQK